mgnify:FL=1
MADRGCGKFFNDDCAILFFIILFLLLFFDNRDFC